MTRRRSDRRFAVVVVCWLLASGPAAALAAGHDPARRDTGYGPTPVRTSIDRAGDDSVTGPRFDALVRTAGSDPNALQQLRRVRRVDGHPVDLGFALNGTAAQTRLRLAALAATVGPGSAGVARPTSGAGARRDAARVLAGDKYRSHPVPRPLRGALVWLGDRLDPVLGPIGRLLAAVAATDAGLLAIVVGLVVITALAATRLISGRSRAAINRLAADTHELIGLGVDPASLERRAADAEADGDHRGAVRLRYQAGLIRLHRADRITLRPDTTVGAVAAQVDSPTLDRLTADFEEIVYGGRPAGSEDAASARTGWAALVGPKAGR